MDALKLITESCMKQDLPEVAVGDTVRVYCKIKEGDHERIQIFEGSVIAKQHGGIAESFTVRRAYGCGIEDFFRSQPLIDKIELVRHGRVRKRNVYLRDRVGKAARSNSPVIESLNFVRSIFS